MELIQLAWWLGIGGIIAGVIGGFYFTIALSKLKGDLKKSLSLLVASSLLYMIFSTIMVLYGVFKIPITDIKWAIVPIIFLINSILYAFGSKNLIDVLKKVKK
jgi:hypothetical protein